MGEPIKENIARQSGYLGGQAGVPILRRTDPEYNDYETGYFQGGVYAGYDRVLLNRKSPRWLLEGSLRLQADYYYLGGDEGNLGSHKHQFSLLGGWKQRFNPFVRWSHTLPFWLFADPMAGLGVAPNRLNFGRGFPLERETSLNILGRLGGGAEYCFHANACLAFKGGYDWERSVAGLGYFQRGWRVGTELEMNFFGPPLERRDPCWEDLSGLRRDLTACEQGLKETYGELTRLQGEMKGLQAVNLRLREAAAQQIEQYREECKDPGIILPDWNGETEPLGPPPHWKWGSLECRDQIEAAEEALDECRHVSLQERRDVLVRQLTEARSVHQKLAAQLEETIQWIYECRKPIRMPDNIITFTNENAVISTEEQKLFGRPLGQNNSKLDNWIIFLNHPDHQKRRVRIHGYANDTGGTAENLRLSQARAENVRRYLVKAHGGVGQAFGPTLVPAGAVPLSRRSNCIGKAPGAELSETYCPIRVKPDRIEKVHGYGSDPAELAKLRERLQQVGYMMNADPKHYDYRMVWLELSDEEGDFR